MHQNGLQQGGGGGGRWGGGGRGFNGVLVVACACVHHAGVCKITSRGVAGCTGMIKKMVSPQTLSGKELHGEVS